MEGFRIGRTVARAITLAKMTFASAGIFVLAVTVLNSGYQLIAQPHLREAMTLAQTSIDTPGQLGLFLSPWYWASILVPTVFGAMTFAGAFPALARAGGQVPPSLADCFRDGFAKLVTMLALTILWYVGVLFGVALLIVPGLILLAMWSVTAPSLAVEDINVIASFARSRQLTRGSRSKILLLVLGFLAVAYSLLFGFVMAGFGIGLDGLSTVSDTPAYVLAMLPGGWITSFLMCALLASIYIETLLVKHGGLSSELVQVFD